MMNKKQALLDVLSGKPSASLPWVPFAGVHAGLLVNKDAKAVLTNEEDLLEALLAVNRLYQPYGQPVMFDLQLEAEVLGCELMWPKDCPPSVKTHPLADTMTVPCRCTLPKQTDGRLGMALNVTRRLKEAVGDETALFGLVCGPFTLAIHLRGNELFMDMFDDEDYVKELLDFCAECARRVGEYYHQAGADIVAVVDPLVSQISRDHFEEFLSKPYTEIFDFFRDKGALSSFFVCGDASRNIESMCHTRPDSIFVDENVNLAAAKRITDEYKVVLGGNIPLTTVMLHGTQQDNMRYVLDMLDSLDNTERFVIAPGCDMPYAVPVENGIAVSQAALYPEETRDMLRDYVAVEDHVQVDLPDYDKLSRPLLEVFTLDSDTCAACTYMLAAAADAKKRFGDQIDMVEYKFTLKENIARCKKMGVKNLPSIYLNGELRFSSIIPSAEELNRQIDQALQGMGTKR